MRIIRGKRKVKKLYVLLAGILVATLTNVCSVWAEESLSSNEISQTSDAVLIDDLSNEKSVDASLDNASIMDKSGVFYDIEEPEICLDNEEESREEEDGIFDTEGVGGFVNRLYHICLDRDPDEKGYQDWINGLKNGERTGIKTAYGFIFSPEFKNKNLCDDDYVEYLYQAFMGRASDPKGKSDWTKELQNGKTREEVFNGFALSDEFRNICKEYNIIVGDGIDIPQYGTVPKSKCSVCGKQDGVTAFVTRLYNVCLDREPDEQGLNTWCNCLWDHSKTGADVAAGFVFSEEFINKDMSDEEFVEYMYRAFFNRPSDSEGKANWCEQMYYYGMNKSHVFAGFTGSNEFRNLCMSYGIEVGTYTPVDDALTPDYVANMSYYTYMKLIMGEYYGQDTLSKEQADSLMTTISIPVWDFLNSNSMTKVPKTVNLTCNKNVASYFQMAFEELFNHPAQPVIHPGSCYAYSYRANVNNPSVLSSHSYGTAIDINPGENPNGKAMVTVDEWNVMPVGSVAQMQKKEYTIYEGSPYYQILYEKYHLAWLGYNRTPDAMHFEF